MNKKQFYQTIESEVKKVIGVQPSYRHAIIAMAALDLTSLNDNDTPQTIQRLAKKSHRVDGHHPATLCVFPQFLSVLDDFKVKKATVVIFPSGQAESLDQIKDEIAYAIDQKADEIDFVADYQAFLSMAAGSEEKIRQEIQTAKQAAGDKPLKVILESAAFGQMDELNDFATLAIENGADFIKTSTGKHEDGGADLEPVTAMALAIRHHADLTGKYVGLKISGGVNGDNYSHYLALTENILGKDFVSNPNLFRFGASGLYDDLQLTIETNGQIKARTPTRTQAPAAY